MSFNVGDKVVYTGSYNSKYFDLLGKIGQIKGIDKDLNSLYAVTFKEVFGSTEYNILRYIQEEDLVLVNDKQSDQKDKVFIIKRTLSELLILIAKESYSVTDEDNCFSRGMFLSGIQQAAREIEDKMIKELSE